MKTINKNFGSTIIFIGALASLPMTAFASKAPWLGVVVDDVNFQQLADAGLNNGVKVTEVIDGSPAKQTGLRAGDILVEINDKPVYSVEQLQWLIGKSEVDQILTIGYERGADHKTTKVALGDAEKVHESNMSHTELATVGSYLGVRLQDLNEGLREIFSAPADAGMLVTQVENNSAAAQSGLKVGDVIVGMASKRIEDMGDVRRVMDYFDPGETINVDLIRNKQAMNLEVKLGGIDFANELGFDIHGHDFGNWVSEADPHHDWGTSHFEESDLDQFNEPGANVGSTNEIKL